MGDGGPRSIDVISLDTSVLVRYLVGTPEAQARRAARAIDHEGEVAISVIALVECAHVLRTQYRVAQVDIIDALIGLLQRRNVTLLGLRTDSAVAGLVRARELPGRPIADALIAAAALEAGAVPLVTFDAEMHRHGVPVERP